MEVKIDRDGCISCGLCEGTCPEVFRIADDGLAEVYHQPDDDAQKAGAQEAAGGCPVSVIHTEG
ncbi:ferredoxin [Butyricicoccus faecihominis]|uniref:ferredoxin n=1 Tax=Butyricicoccaceae TaxID=3085642 RepID=UPI002478A9A7|nr:MULTISPECIES: ferredoxin [Butyricicoccaceae]MCQ5129501.1 ferredoxin [Butyricicoccus faecihominis]WNX84630.1 ferredoxin [Agathobaculum sp. NTUH-O15-33]